MRLASLLAPAGIAQRRAFARLSVVHALHSAAETLFAISLAGSLFFSVSLDAARPRILLYLALTLAPFAVLAPLIGPVIDKVRGGHRMVLLLTLVGRGVLAALLSGRELSLWLYPLAFGVLVLGKTYSVARNALVPTLASGAHELVRANSRLAIMGTCGGALGAAIGAPLFELTDSGVVLWVTMAVYVAGGLAVLSMRPEPAPRHDALEELEEYVEITSPGIRNAAIGMAALRAAVGFVTFHLGFALKSGGAPLWIFGVVLVANGVGGILGTLASPALRRRLDEHRMLTVGLALPATVAVVTALRFNWVTVVAISLGLGAGVAIGRRAFDNVVQERAPHGSRGAAYVGLETRLELSWVAGALVAVSARAAGWLGALVLAAGLSGVAVARMSGTRWGSRVGAILGRAPVSRQLLVTAEELDRAGETRQAAVIIGAAVDAAFDESGAPQEVSGGIDGLRTVVEDNRRRAVAGEAVDVVAALAAARGIVRSLEQRA